jgi:hypothetical protein
MDYPADGESLATDAKAEGHALRDAEVEAEAERWPNECECERHR